MNLNGMLNVENTAIIAIHAYKFQERFHKKFFDRRNLFTSTIFFFRSKIEARIYTFFITSHICHALTQIRMKYFFLAFIEYRATVSFLISRV